EPPALIRSDRREIALVYGPREEVDLVHGADDRGSRTHGLMVFNRGDREVGEPLREVRAALIDAIGRAVVEKVPDDLETEMLRGLQRSLPTRPVVSAGRFLDQVPTKAVAKRPHAE